MYIERLLQGGYRLQARITIEDEDEKQQVKKVQQMSSTKKVEKWRGEIADGYNKWYIRVMGMGNAQSIMVVMIALMD